MHRSGKHIGTVGSEVIDSHDVPARGTVDLSRLNDAERRMLRLLAEGHTAKSIAATLDTTLAAVNERLREARRKTGLGSSRELARLMKAQENRDDEIGLGKGPEPAVQSESTNESSFRSDWKGPIAMTLALVTIVAAAAMIVQQPGSRAEESAGPAVSDPLLGNLFAERGEPASIGEGGQPNLRGLYARVRSESRGEPWSTQTEAQVRSLVSRLPPVILAHAPLRVTCSATLCEIATTSGLHPPQAAVDHLLNEMQSPSLAEQMESAGLRNVTTLFRKHPSAERQIYLSYWTRNR